MTYNDLRETITAERDALLRQDHLTDDQRARVRAVTSWADHALSTTAMDASLSPAERDMKAASIAERAQFEAWQAAKSNQVAKIIESAGMTDAQYYAAMRRLGQ